MAIVVEPYATTGLGEFDDTENICQRSGNTSGEKGAG